VQVVSAGEGSLTFVLADDRMGLVVMDSTRAMESLLHVVSTEAVPTTGNGTVAMETTLGTGDAVGQIHVVENRGPTKVEENSPEIEVADVGTKLFSMVEHDEVLRLNEEVLKVNDGFKGIDASPPLPSTSLA
jgi:hypothetical protein